MFYNDSNVNHTGLVELCAHYHSYDTRTFVMFGFLAPVLIIFGVTANVINLLAFTDSHMRYVLINWYLIGLALCDCAILLMSFLMLSIPTLTDYTQAWRWIGMSNRLTKWVYPVAVIAQTEAVGLTVLVAVHRCIGVCFPFRDRLITEARVKWCLAALSLFALAYNFPRFFEIELTPCWSDQFNVTVETLVASELRSDPLYLQFFVLWSYTTIMFALPFLLLIVTSAFTISAVRRSWHSSGLRRSYGGQHGESESHKELSTTLMLTAIVIEFMTFNSFAFFTNILEYVIYANQGERQEWFNSLYSVSADLANFAVLSNSSCNIFIYYRFSRKYREVLRVKMARSGPTHAAAVDQRVPLLPLKQNTRLNAIGNNS